MLNSLEASVLMVGLVLAIHTIMAIINRRRP